MQPRNFNMTNNGMASAQHGLDSFITNPHNPNLLINGEDSLINPHSFDTTKKQGTSKSSFHKKNVRSGEGKKIIPLVSSLN